MAVFCHYIEQFESQFGWFGLAWSERGLAAVTFGHQDGEQARLALGCLEALGKPLEGSSDRPDSLIPRLRAYCSGRSDDFLDTPLDLTDLTDFQRRVTLACRRIPWGETCTYGELASRIGSPRAARAVGSVMARNRLPIVIPCHRVLGAWRQLGGYSAPGGLDTKRRLLCLEGAHDFCRRKGVWHG